MGDFISSGGGGSAVNGWPDHLEPVRSHVPIKDVQMLMSGAAFRPSKKNRQIGHPIRYSAGSFNTTVSAGEAGMATAWDYDIFLMANSHFVDNINKQESQSEPAHFYCLPLDMILDFCQRGDGGNQYRGLPEALLRLSTTHVERKRQQGDYKGGIVLQTIGGPLIGRYKIILNRVTGKPQAAIVEISNWIYKEIISDLAHNVLTLDKGYFNLTSPLERMLYRLARRAAGNSYAKCSFEQVYVRSGSSRSRAEFGSCLRKMIAVNNLPGYDLAERPGVSGPVLTMTKRADVGH